MGLRINTNIPAQYAVYNLTNTNNKLAESLNRLSTGLRITKAADDAAGMTIADGLKFQSLNLGQAINNGNNAIKLIQIADMALQKSVDIVQTIAQKATQAANATEDQASRNAIQAEITKLIEEVNNIANTTSYKDTKLLNGSFLGKIVQIGAYMNQTISIGALSTKANAIGRVADATLSAVDFNETTENAFNNGAVGYNANINRVVYNNDELKINDVFVGNKITGINEDRQISAKTIAAAINSVQEQTGVEAQAETVVVGNGPIAAGSIADGGLLINGVNIGHVVVGAGDATGALVNAINNYTDQTGVIASVDEQGRLVLTAKDGRNIAIETTANAQSITGLATAEAITSGGQQNTLNSDITAYIDGVKIDLAAGTTGGNAAALINSALKQAGIDTVTQLRASTNANGALTLLGRDGRDLNIVLSDTGGTPAPSTLSFFGINNNAQTDGNNAYYLANGSHHGKVELISDKDIYVNVKDSAAIGFETQNLGLNKTLESVDVTTQKGAELAIKIAQVALSNLDKVRSDLGAIQNQIQATVENISVTQININAAESTIRDVNFAKESSNFSKLQILAQSGTYALAQANAVQQNVLRLLQ